MASDLIETASGLAGVAIHEAAHCLAACLLGGRAEAASLDLLRITGEATFVPPPRGADHGLTAICGSVAQARFAGFPQWRALVSPTDYQSLAKAANSVGIFESAAIEEFGERAAARAHQFLDRHWPQVRMLAAKLLEAGGQLNAQQIESALSTRVAFNLQQGPPRKMAHEVHVRRRSKAILDYDPY